jgi:hypothetical protein
VLGADFFLRGKDFFVDALDEYYSNDEINKLYDFFKDEVYRGREYKDFKRIK